MNPQMQLQNSMNLLNPQMAQMQMNLPPFAQNQISPQMQMHPGMKPPGLFNPSQQLMSMNSQNFSTAAIQDKHPDLAIPVPDQYPQLTQQRAEQPHE